MKCCLRLNTDFGRHFYFKMETKKCNACLEEKTIDNFHKDKYRPDGHCNKCKKCFNEKKPSIKVLILIGESKVCPVCTTEKDLLFFPKRNDRSYKYESRCKDCKDSHLYIDKEILKNGEKKCPNCKEYKIYEQYHKCKTCLEGIASICKICAIERMKNRRDSTPPEIKKQNKKEDYLKNKERYKKASLKYKENNRDHLKKKGRERHNKKFKNCPNYKLKLNISCLIRATFTKNTDKKYKKKSRTVEILGCTIEEFRIYLEKQFLPWMTWENHGNCEELAYNCSWDLDHIIPISYAKTEEEVYMLNHWSNFQPLCSKINRYEKKDNLYTCSNLELKITVTDNQIIINEK